MIGFHVQKWTPGTHDTVAAANARIVKVMDADPEVIRKLIAQRPDLIVVCRQYFHDSEQSIFLQQGYAGGMLCARRVAATYAAIRGIVPASQLYIEGLNEIGLWNDADAYDAFTTGFAEECASVGIRPAAYCFPTGNPPGYGNPPDLKSYWAHYVAGLRATKAAGGALALHEYAWPTMQTDQTWLCLRYRRVLPILPEDVQDIPILITECGIDYGAAGIGRRHAEEAGWRHTDPPTTPEMYADQLRWYASELAKDRQVIGATVFTAGNADKWTSFDVTGLEPVIACLREINAHEEAPVVSIPVLPIPTGSVQIAFDLPMPPAVEGQPYEVHPKLFHTSGQPALVQGVGTAFLRMPRNPDDSLMGTQTDEVRFDPESEKLDPSDIDGKLSFTFDVPHFPAAGPVNGVLEIHFIVMDPHDVGATYPVAATVPIEYVPGVPQQEEPVTETPAPQDGDVTPAGIMRSREPFMWGKIWGWSEQALANQISAAGFAEALQAAVRWGKGQADQTELPSDPR